MIILKIIYVVAFLGAIVYFIKATIDCVRIYLSERKGENRTNQETTEMLKRLTPTDLCNRFETMIESLSLATIFPRDFFVVEIAAEKRTGNKKTVSERRESLEKFFLTNPAHPLRPEKTRHFVFLIQECLKSGSETKLQAIQHFLEPEFISAFKKSFIIPDHCEREIFCAEMFLGETLSIKDEIGNMHDFFSRIPTHPLRSKEINNLASVLDLISKDTCSANENMQKLFDLMNTGWNSNGYYIGGGLIFKAFKIGEERVAQS